MSPPGTLLVAFALALTPVSAASATERRAAARPNVLVFVTDDQTAEQLRVMSRTVRLIGGRGATFANAFVGLPLCCPSRATLLTGQYAHNHGVRTNLPPNGGYERLDHTNTLPVWLQFAGYTTVHLGKYLNNYGVRNPHEVPPGWSEWHGLVDPTTYRFYDFTFNDGGMLTTFGHTPFDYQTDVIARRGVEIVRRRAAEARPFFMLVDFLAPHAGAPATADDPPGNLLFTPEPAPRHRNAFARELLPRGAIDEPDVSDKPARIQRLPRLTQALRDAIRESYQQELESLLAVDEAIQTIVGALRRSGELKRTYVLFTSDNGLFHGEHRIPTGKLLAYEPAIRVPLLVRGPGIRAGRVASQLVSNVDLAPTIVDIADARSGLPLDGRSLMPLLRDPGVEWGRDLLVESAGLNEFSAIRTRRFMWIEHGTGEQELYDLLLDPEQRASLHRRPETAALRASLSARLARLRRCRGPGCRAQPRLGLTISGARGSHRARGCRRGRLAARVGGPDLPGVVRAAFNVGGKAPRVDRRPPFRFRFARDAPRRGRSVRLRVRVALEHDRALTLGRRVRRC